MIYDFDQEINPHGTNSVKWECVPSDNGLVPWDKTDPALGNDRVLPMWVADMDFCSPQPVIDALVERARHGIFGYAVPTERYYQAVVDWMARRHGWPDSTEPSSSIAVRSRPHCSRMRLESVCTCDNRPSGKGEIEESRRARPPLSLADCSNSIASRFMRCRPLSMSRLPARTRMGKPRLLNGLIMRLRLSESSSWE